MTLRFPTSHLADETAARIMVAAKRIRERDAIHVGELAPELVGQPSSSSSTAQGAAAGAVAAGATADATGGPPQGAPPGPQGMPLDQAPLDPLTVAHGGSSFDALTKDVLGSKQPGG